MKKLLLLPLLSGFIFAITLVPMSDTLDSKKQKNIVFKVSNPTKDPVAVNFSILKVIGTDGLKEERETTTLVQAYPTQFVLSPKETKSVRVRYMGKKLPDIEEVYRVIAQELDIDVSDKKEDTSKGKIKAQIKMHFSYEGLLFIHQADAKENLSIKEINLEGTSLSIQVENSGNTSAVPMLNLYNYIAVVGGKEHLLIAEDLNGMELRRILAGKTNTFMLKRIKSVAVNKITSMRLEKK